MFLLFLLLFFCPFGSVWCRVCCTVWRQILYYIPNYCTPLETQKHPSIHLCIHSNLCLQILELPLIKLFAQNILQKKALNKAHVKKQYAFWTPLIVEDRQLSSYLDLKLFSHSKYIKTFSDLSTEGQIRSCRLNFEMWFHNSIKNSTGIFYQEPDKRKCRRWFATTSV